MSKKPLYILNTHPQNLGPTTTQALVLVLDGSRQTRRRAPLVLGRPMREAPRTRTAPMPADLARGSSSSSGVVIDVCRHAQVDVPRQRLQRHYLRPRVPLAPPVPTAWPHLGSVDHHGARAGRLVGCRHEQSDMADHYPSPPMSQHALGTCSPWRDGESCGSTGIVVATCKSLLSASRKGS